ncbi:hypothetical protein J7J45_05765, partial [Candidatus Aerophobetes bacterium]|nr:hypothetical protein [Candidatus Aerophobetes bacterium]
WQVSVACGLPKFSISHTYITTAKIILIITYILNYIKLQWAKIGQFEEKILIFLHSLFIY